MVETALDAGGAVAFWSLAAWSDRHRLADALAPLGFGNHVPEPRPAPAALRDPTEFELELLRKNEMIAHISREPLTVAMIVADPDSDKPRLLVFGDTDFLSNEDMKMSPTREQNFDLVLSGLESMAEHTGRVGARPKESTAYILPAASSESLSRMVHVPGWLMLLTLLGLGTGIWLVRRR